MSKPTQEELLAAWERDQKVKARNKAYYQRPEVKARNKAYFSELRRLAQMAREAGL